MEMIRSKSIILEKPVYVYYYINSVILHNILNPTLTFSIFEIFKGLRKTCRYLNLKQDKEGTL